jgi:UDP-3-O-[3-hydroxymyristoyl] glucosamine N-acyltransferase
VSDPRFFSRSGPFSLREVAAAVDGSLQDGADGDRVIADVAPLDGAGSDDLSFLDNRKYIAAFEASRAGFCLVAAEFAARAPAGMTVIVCEQPYLAFALAARKFYPQAAPEPWISPDARIDREAELGADCRVEAFAVIGAGARIGARCHIEAGATLGAGVILGDDCRVGSGASLLCCIVGSRVAIDPGARIGTQGFGFAVGPRGPVRIPHTGRVVIEDDVEIGANTTIDRGTTGDTFIGRGTMIDNQVQIAHNVQIGRGCILAGQAGLAGSSQMGDYAMIGGKSGLANHVKLGKGARVGAQSGVADDLEAGGTYLGAPAIPIKDFWRQQIAIRRLVSRGKGA